ncbi:MAG: hypothetical protein K2P35_10155 [Lachnospiraceae bacterium]|nr:hypothetical protein [Lachnospiraceae bacterium]NDO52039.1 hypothetical protein [Lachnospiraceae bacterium MD335]
MENGKAMEYRANVRMSEELYNSINYWAEKKGVKVTDYIRDALLLQIKRDNKDYDLPSLEAHRLNQIIDSLELVSANMSCLQDIVQSNFGNLLAVVSGTNYLMD